MFNNTIIQDHEASNLFDKLEAESKTKKGVQSNWKDEETHLLQWAVFNYMVKKDMQSKNFVQQDWELIAELVPNKDAKKCQKKWLWI